MKQMKQLNSADIGYLPNVGKQTRKAVFLAKLETVVAWSRLESLIESFYPEKGNACQTMPLDTMLRTDYMQQWIAYSGPAMEEALHDVPLVSQFGFVKVCYRSLAKNSGQSLKLFLLSNLWMARMRLLPLRVEVRP